MTKTLSLSEVKGKLSSLVDGIEKRDDEIVITRNGKPVAVILSADELESLKETLEIQSNPSFMRQIRAGLKAHKKGKVLKYTSLDDLFNLSK